jgi:hypothetical protein
MKFGLICEDNRPGRRALDLKAIERCADGRTVCRNLQQRSQSNLTITEEIINAHRNSESNGKYRTFC